MAYNYRHYLYSARRWTAPAANTASTAASQGLGTGATPNTDWASKGIFVPAGSQLRAFTVAGAVSGTEIENIDINIYHQHGPWNGGWSSATTTQRTTLYTQANAGFSAISGMSRYRYPLSFTTPADGYVFLTTRPSLASTMTTTQYFDCAGVLDVSCPLDPV